MARVEGRDVKDIMDTSMTAVQIEPFIKIANMIVDDKLSGEGYDESYLREIERWLAAHFASIREGVVQQEKVGDAAVTYAPTVGISSKGLDASPYGRQVKVLDTSGILANMGKKKVHFEMVN